jgi:hypothetical protein
LSFVHSPGQLKNQLLSYFQNNYATFTAAVNAEWNDGVSLPTIADVFIGDATKTKEIKQFPTVAVLSGDVFPVFTERVQQFSNTQWQTGIFIRTFLRHANVSTLEKYLDRTLEAQLQMFEADPYNHLSGLAKSFEFMRAEPTDSWNPPGASIYIRCLETQWQCQHT